MPSKRPARLRFTPMSPRKKPSPEGAYDLGRVTAEIEHGRKRRGLSVKALAADVGIGRKVWYKKRDMDESTFSFDDMSRIAKALDAPPGWPLLPWELAEDFADWRKSRRG